MRRSSKLALLIGVVAFTEARAQAPAVAPPPPQIVVMGDGEVRVPPDRARISLGVTSRALTAAAAAAANARTQKAIIDTLKALGFGPDQIATMNYHVAPEMQYDRTGGAPKVIGYTVTNTVRAELRRLEDVAKVIDAALAKGANQVSGLDFYAANIDDARRTAMSMALAKARSDAEAIARAAGGSIGTMLEAVSGGFAPPQPVPFMMKDYAAARAEAVPTPIEPGQEVVRATVTTRWVFVPNPR